MQISQKSKQHIDSCRFCWMCHHICPIGNATGLERNTARARALGLSLVARGAVPYSKDMIDNVYECALCGGCVHECVTGWDPVMFTKEARLAAALEGKLPPYIQKMLIHLQETGNIYGEEPKADIPELPDSDTLFFLGQDARVKGDCKAAILLLQKAGVPFTILRDEPNSGYAMDFMVGAAAETKDMMKKCADVLKPFQRVICYDPADAKVMKREYKEWGIDLVPEVITFTGFLAELIHSGKLQVKKQNLTFTPQDSPLLARDLEEVQPMRDILSACGTVKEMLLYGENTMMAGNLIMNEYMPDVMKKVAANRWVNAKNAGAENVVTQSPAEYILLNAVKPENINLLSLEEAVLACL
ncbi:(Fe-S)-binding protein [Ructibacterium gallinarum]|uniref:(Fe-S)-binding protein n=1 Tax=Ructibacterium gallinarum TaxID=2779355 RepID=A0A9D5R8S8_9FIRM|nr:(Fe-S)-binding protein [Ructibacterium gallinarum]MBE5040736.1 (Fe-S)-binding protein [Ructibacterium gallinarum]